MDKKRKLSVLITLVSVLTILSGILSLKIFNQINTSSNTEDGIVVENTSNSKEAGTTIKKDKSTEITTRNYLIKTVYLDGRKAAILKDEEGSELKLPMTVSGKFNGTFSLQTTEGSPDNLKVGQTIIPSKNDEVYSFVKQKNGAKASQALAPFSILQEVQLFQHQGLNTVDVVDT